MNRVRLKLRSGKLDLNLFVSIQKFFHVIRRDTSMQVTIDHHYRRMVAGTKTDDG